MIGGNWNYHCFTWQFLKSFWDSISYLAGGLFGILGSRCLTASALLDCHVLKGFGIYMIGILDSLSDVVEALFGHPSCNLDMQSLLDNIEGIESPFFPFRPLTKLPHPYIRCTSRGHTGGRSHRIYHPTSFCGVCLYFSREEDSAVPFPRRPWGRILCTDDLFIVLHLFLFYFSFFFNEEKYQLLTGIRTHVPTCQVTRLPTELPGRLAAAPINTVCSGK